MSALSVQRLEKRYGTEAAVDGLDLDVEPGALYGFLGPNGAGKTTTIRMMLGLVRPTAGTVTVLGEPLYGNAGLRPAGASARALRRVGALVEEPAFWGYLSGRRNLEFYARAAGPADDRRRRLGRVDEVLATVELSAAAGQKVKAYSQGMRQRLGIARALLGDPELLVLDEPTNGLDPEGMRAVRRLLRALADAGTTVFVSSHLLAEVEAMCDHVAVLARGRLVAEGPPGGLPTLAPSLAGGPGAATRVRVEVAVGDRSRALAILGRIHGVALEQDGGGALRLRLPEAVSSAQVNAALVDGGVAVHALVPERQRLEDVYLALVAGAGPPRPG